MVRAGGVEPPKNDAGFKPAASTDSATRGLLLTIHESIPEP